MLPLHHTKMMMYLHLTVTCQMMICHLVVTIYLMKVRVPPMMTGAVKMTLSVVTCVCGALGRAHKRDCPMSSRSSLPTEVYSTDSHLNQSDSVWEVVAKPKPNLSKFGKRKSQEVEKHPVIKKQQVTTSSFEVGNCLPA